ncbi:hypothetical protein JZ751_021503, partial [Albula glossodonta]
MEEEPVMMKPCCFLQLLGFLCLIGSSSEADPCMNYLEVSGTWRNIGFTAFKFVGYPLCDNLLAGYWIRFTGIGYKLPEDALPNTASYGCIDIDECLEDSIICGPNATCTNIIANYTCTCHDGYHVISLESRISAQNPCEDIDECIQINCGSNGLCYNIPGDFYCTCQIGYGQKKEVFFLKQLSKELENKSDIILPEGVVTGVLTTALLVTDNMFPEEGEDGSGGSGGDSASQAEAASAILKLSEGLVSALVEPTEIQSRKTVETPKMGSAAAVLMSVSGMEKLMGPSFFETENVTEMYSGIITATLPKTNHRELPDPVKFTISHKTKFHAGLVTCVYWDDKGKEKNWSVDGCTATFSNETHTVCSCTHLSTFAILLQTEEQAEDDELLEWVNLICMAVGLAFLGLAILSFLLCSWNPKINNTARLHLSICLFLGHLLFLVGVSRTENETVCAVIAGLLHFLFLSSFVFMLLETLQLFLLVRSLSQVRVIQKEGLRPLYLLLIGYGAPVVVVGISAGVFPEGYGSKD